MDKPTEEERLNFVRSYGVEPVDVNTDLTFKDAATAVAEMTPIIGDAMAAKEVYDELMKDEPNYGLIAALGGAALVGAVPGIGDAAAAGIRKAVDLAKRVEVDPDAVGMMGGNIRIKPKAKEGTPTVEAAGLTDEAIEKWRNKNATPEDFRKSLKGRNEELQEAAAGVEEGRVFTSTYRKLADDLRPIRKVTEVPKPATFVEAVSALNAGKRKKPMIGLNASIPDGDEITARLDIDAYTDYDVWVPTLTHPELKTVYKPSVILEDVTFIKPEGREPKKALGVAKGGAKAPFAVMTGKYVEASDDEAFKLAKDVFDNDDVTQVGYDPTRRGFFYDRETGEAVVQADQVVQVGHLVLARNAKKMDAEAFPFNKGGIAMKEQMEMNFGDVPDNTIGVDPVSGNDIPLGSTAENVRDDIPANLSEGEIVIAADVVNFHGVKLFEDLRKEAKMGYAQMAEDGRIGGEPMDMDTANVGIEISLEDLEIEDDGREDAFLGKFFAGIREANKRQAEKNKQAAKDKVHKIFQAAANKDKNKNNKKTNDDKKYKNNFERMLAAFRDDSDQKKPTRPQLTEKPPTSDNVAGPSIAEQINFGGDYRDSPQQPPAGSVTTSYKAPKGGQQTSETQNVRYYDEGFITRLLTNLGLDEGGLVEDRPDFTLPVEPDPVEPDNPPRKVFEQRGGFDMGKISRNPRVQVYEYVNAEGHRIFITYIDGIPQSEVPPGYVLSGEPIDINSVYYDPENPDPTKPTDPEDPTDPETPEDPPEEGGTTTTSGGGSSDDDGTPDTPESFNYKELTMDELKDLVDEMSSFGTKLAGLNPVTKVMVKISHKQTIKEIERRLADPNTSEVDKMRYQNLLELANRKQPGLVKTVADFITGNTTATQAGQIPKPVIPDVDYSDPTHAPTPYTPDAQTATDTTSPGVPNPFRGPTYDEVASQTKPEENDEPTVPESYDPIPEAGSGFGGMGPDPAEEFAGSQTRFQQTEEPEVLGDSRQERDSQRRRDRQESNKNIAGKSTKTKTRSTQSATRGLSSKQKTGGAGLDSRFGITGLNKGGLAKKKTKKSK